MRSFATSVVRLLDPVLPSTLELDGGFTMAEFGPATTDPTAPWDQRLRTGVLLFLRAETDGLDLDVLAHDLRRFLAEPGNADAGLLWIEHPDAPLDRWVTNAIPLTAASDTEALTVPRVAHVDVRNYAIVVPAGSVLAIESEGGVERAVLRSEGSDRPACTTGHGRHRHRLARPEVGVGLSGASAGCLDLTVAVDLEGTVDDDWRGYPALAQLDVGFRLFFPDPDVPPQRGRAALASHRYPLIDEYTTNRRSFAHLPPELQLDAVLDPLHPLAPERSHLGWRSTGRSSDPVDLPSGYRTNMGYSVHLTASASSRLQFAERPLGPTPAAAERNGHRRPDLYLTPAGSYGLSVPRYGGPVDRPEQVPGPRMVCGLSGLEYVEVEAGETELVFVPGQAAVLDGHRSVSALLRDLPVIIEEAAQIVLTADTGDQDQPISRDQTAAVLERLRGLHLPIDLRLSPRQRAQLERVSVVDEFIAWLRTRIWESAGGEGARPGAALSSGAVTSWVWVRNRAPEPGVAPEPVVYHAQPEPATLYHPGPAAEVGDTGVANPGTGTTELLEYLEVPAAWLPAALTPAQLEVPALTGLTTSAVPMLPYGGTDRGALTDLRRVEEQILIGYRRNLIQRICAAAGHPAPSGLPASETGAATVQGTTPQGLVATFSADRRDLDEVRLANDTAGDALALEGLAHGSSLKAMFQTSKLFAVISDPAVVAERLTGSPLEIAEWEFELDPDRWPKHDTVLVFKYQDRPLLDLVDDPRSWFDAEAFNGSSADIDRLARRLGDTLRRAVDASTSDDPKERRKFRALARAATQPNWSGILAFDVAVPLRGLPDALLALASGIDPDRFFASFVGIETTPIEVETGAEPSLAQGTSSMFGLIDYTDPNIPRAGESGYNFHVPSLSLVLANSEVADFAAEVVLVADRLFGETTTLIDAPQDRNLLRLVGVAEERDGRVSYSFGFQGANRFRLAGAAIDEVEVTRAQFVTDPVGPPVDGRRAVTGRFLLWTVVRFRYRPEFDILSFGATPGTMPEVESGPTGLSVDNLQVTLSFELPDDGPVTGKRFAFLADRLSLDLGRSGHRQHSLYEKFPLALKGFGPIQTGAQAERGFLPVTTPEPTAELGAEAYALTFDLNLGSVGALAGGVGLVVRVRAAWSPGGEGLFVGLKLPGSGGGAKRLTIQGIITIGFEEIRFIVHQLGDEAGADPEAERPVGYLLKLRNLTLKVLVLTLPTSGTTEVLLFGDPRDDIERKERLLGWFGSYDRRPSGDEAEVV